MRRTEALKAIDHQSGDRNNRIRVVIVDQGMNQTYVGAIGGSGTYAGLLWKRWVIVNAWGVKNRLRETPLGGLSATECHGLNQKIATLANNAPGAPYRRVEVVLAAGNNGTFTPDPETGPYDRGPHEVSCSRLR